MKIFQIGFNRCGTNSLAHFFHRNGYPAVHWDRGKLAASMLQNDLLGRPLLTGYDGYVFFSDMERAHSNYAHVEYYQKLDAEYPGSRFILNTRDRERWLDSRCRFADGQYLQKACAFYGKPAANVRKIWSDAWDQHLENVSVYFAGRDNLLRFDIEREDGRALQVFFADLQLDPAHWSNHSTFFLRTDVDRTDGSFFGFSGPRISETRCS